MAYLHASGALHAARSGDTICSTRYSLTCDHRAAAMQCMCHLMTKFTQRIAPEVNRYYTSLSHKCPSQLHVLEQLQYMCDGLSLGLSQKHVVAVPGSTSLHTIEFSVQGSHGPTIHGCGGPTSTPEYLHQNRAKLSTNYQSMGHAATSTVMLMPLWFECGTRHVRTRCHNSTQTKDSLG